MSAIKAFAMSILMLMFVVGAVGVAAAVGPDGKDDAVKADLMKLEGTWRLVSLEVGGKPANPEILGRNVRRIFSGTTCSYHSGFRGISCKFTINPSKTPKWIDVTDQAGVQVQGIYELKGDTLRLFLQKKGERPTEFKTKEGTQQGIQTYERVKEGEKGGGKEKRAIEKRDAEALQNDATVREIDLKGFRRIDGLKDDVTDPTPIKDAEGLAKSFPEKGWQAKLGKEVDFTKEYLLYFAWFGSSGDRLSCKVEKGEKGPSVHFLGSLGLTKDDVPHWHLYAVPQNATWDFRKK